MSDDWFLGYSAGDKVKILSDVRIREENKKWYDRLVKVINNFAKRYVDEPPCSCQNNWDAYGEFPNF